MINQESAEIIVNKLNLLPILNVYGEAHLVGNVALKTTVKPDIDFQIYAKNGFLKDAENIKPLLEEKGIRNVVIRELKQSDKVLVTGLYDSDGVEWAVDISLTKPSDDFLNDAFRFYQEFDDKFNDINRKTIIHLKKYLLKKGMLWNGMSYYVYRSVLENDARTANDVFAYLKENNINISRFKKR